MHGRVRFDFSASVEALAKCPARAGWLQLDPAGSGGIQLDQAGSSWIQLYPVGSSWIQLDLGWIRAGSSFKSDLVPAIACQALSPQLLAKRSRGQGRFGNS